MFTWGKKKLELYILALMYNSCKKRTLTGGLHFLVDDSYWCSQLKFKFQSVWFISWKFYLYRSKYGYRTKYSFWINISTIVWNVFNNHKLVCYTPIFSHIYNLPWHLYDRSFSFLHIDFITFTENRSTSERHSDNTCSTL